jgi:hypothetical protein
VRTSAGVMEGTRETRRFGSTVGKLVVGAGAVQEEEEEEAVREEEEEMEMEMVGVGAVQRRGQCTSFFWNRIHW